jgi:hypothetical protein
MLIIGNTSTLEKWKNGTNGKCIKLEDLCSYDPSIPVTIRGAKRNSGSALIVEQCIKEGRDFYFMDNGYFGNHVKTKIYSRIVLNGFHHSKYVEVPDDRFNNVVATVNNRYDLINNINRYDLFSEEWHKKGDDILIIAPGRLNQYFWKLDIDKWISETVDMLKKHTDRNIIIREKPVKNERTGDKHIYNQLDKTFAVVTTNSLSAVEAIGFGIPCFTSNHHSMVDLCSEDLSKIETPYYPDRDKVLKHLHWLAYCQYTKNELENGVAYSIIKQYGLR